LSSEDAAQVRSQLVARHPGDALDLDHKLGIDKGLAIRPVGDRLLWPSDCTSGLPSEDHPDDYGEAAMLSGHRNVSAAFGSSSPAAMRRKSGRSLDNLRQISVLMVRGAWHFDGPD
jgi:hypothetical protein